MQKSFNVLDRNLNIRRNYFLEASAGTGKTFSIENIVLRLLLEEDFLIEHILVVTFTRAATRDLKNRIRTNLEKALDSLLEKGTPPDYLKAIIEKGKEAVQSAKRRLEQALFCFDQAQIFTIHSFCARMLRDHLLEGDIGPDSIDVEDTLTDTEMIAAIRDYFRTELQTAFGKEQLNIISREYGHSTEQLERALLKAVKSSGEIKELPSLALQSKRFEEVMRIIKKNYGIASDKVMADFVIQAPHYSRNGVVKSEVLEKATRFAKLFDGDKWNDEQFDSLLADGLVMLNALDPAKRKKSAPAHSLHYPDLINILRSELFPLVEQAQNPALIFAAMAKGCQELIQKRLHEEDKYRYDDILQKMAKALDNPDFSRRIQRAYKAAIIDEFQDTDPIQWKIFNKLFVEAGTKGYLYLVGDPKQSIYSFRQADIYTYLDAAKAVGSEHHATLDINFRSQPSLVHALNHLFSPTLTPALIALPRLNEELKYRNVSPSNGAKELIFGDEKGSIHFCIAKSQTERGKPLPLEKIETHLFFPFFAEEIQRLTSNDSIRFNQIAVLVSDRFQAQRVASFLNSCQIPTTLQRAASLADSSALPAMRELLQGVLHPRDDSAIKTALGGPIIGWSQGQVRKLSNDYALREKVLVQSYSLRKIWLEQGFGVFFHQLMQSKWPDSSFTIAENLLAQESGIEFFDDLQQISHLLLEQESSSSASAEALVVFLDHFPTLDFNEDGRIKKVPNTDLDAVQVLTIHSSKGLEFEIVFALGLATRTKSPDPLLSLQNSTKDENTLYQECDAEKMRQLYVAFTRAKYRVYAPVIISPSGKEIELATASPMELFLARLGQPKASLDVLYDRIPNFDGQPLYQMIKELPADIKISYTDLTIQPYEAAPRHTDSSIVLEPPPRVYVPSQRHFLHSFTTLAKETPQLRDHAAPKDPLSEIKNAHTLPAGKETGIILHKLLETIALHSAFEEESFYEVVCACIRGTSLSGWEEVICKMVVNAWNVPLQIGGKPFRLRDIPNEKRYHEMEFIYPYTTHTNIEELKQFPGYLKGVIDLIFEHEGIYYIIDWKSNWLDPENYSEPALEQAMHAHDYFLQAKIYTAALERYLRLVDPRPFKDIFGGAIYLFLRGLDSPHHGVYKVLNTNV